MNCVLLSQFRFLRALFCCANIAIPLISAAHAQNTSVESKLVVQLNGPIDTASAGFLIGRENGTFDQEGIKLELSAGRDDLDAIDKIRTGSAFVGAASAAQFLVSYARQPGITAFAALFLESTLVFYSKTAL